jgi:tetratricopeptide (TPR) repeat protein
MTVLLLLLIANAAYLAALPAANIFYIANLFLHLGLGLVACGWLLWRSRTSAKILPLLIGTLIGAYLIYAGATTDHFKILWAHIALAVAGLALLKPRWTAAIAALTVTAAALRFGLPKDRIVNPKVVPTAMTEEGGGPHSPFWPSSSRTSVGGTMPSDFFMESKQCGECHKDIYDQWQSSMHHFASFNNPFYRATILHMQELSGTEGSKFCAGCHDHAVFFNGRFDTPMKQQADTPEAQVGLGCVSCHSITHVDSTIGNGDFEIEYPPMHRLASSRNPFLAAAGKFVIYLNPEPHRRTFMKAFMTDQTSEFCTACHKVHLDEPVNHYRWIRGFNDYDSWQASGVSGQGARSFYYPAKFSGCADCHMAQVASQDPGNRNGMVHSHRFAAANTAMPTVTHDDAQLNATEAFLKSGFITVDLFSASPVEGAPKGQVEMKRRTDNAPSIASTFAVGEEAEQSGPVMLREVGNLAAPIDAPGVALAPGSKVRIDAVVRTRKIGHFFPAGTVDTFDVWLEFSARDAKGRVLASSGAVEDNGRGRVDRSAHFYRSYLLDGEGNEIDKRNAWQARSVFYVHLIPPGAADTVHYIVNIPRDAQGSVTFEVKLHYRKFTSTYTRFSFGAAKPGAAGISYDSREYVADPAKLPVLPIVTLASASATVPLGEPHWKPVIRKEDRERWNDWGIGLLLQGDLKGAEYAFERVTEAEPSYADGWLNVARALIQEGEIAAAVPYIAKALELSPKLGRAEVFLAAAQKSEGNYDAALLTLADVRRQFPRDRVVIDQVGRILFLQRRYAEAVAAFKDTLAVDPEDLQAHYNLMLCYRGLGQNENAAREEKLFLRFKADESAQSLTEKPRLLHPEENNERQPVHDHDALPPVSIGHPTARHASTGVND